MIRNGFVLSLFASFFFVGYPVSANERVDIKHEGRTISVTIPPDLPPGLNTNSLLDFTVTAAVDPFVKKPHLFIRKLIKDDKAGQRPFGGYWLGVTAKSGKNNYLTVDLNAETAALKREIDSEWSSAENQAGRALTEGAYIERMFQLERVSYLKPHDTQRGITLLSQVGTFPAFFRPKSPNWVQTTAIIAAGGLRIQLGVAGGEGDLEWTRAEAKAWAEKVLAENSPSFGKLFSGFFSGDSANGGMSTSGRIFLALSAIGLFVGVGTIIWKATSKPKARRKRVKKSRQYAPVPEAAPPLRPRPGSRPRVSATRRPHGPVINPRDVLRQAAQQVNASFPNQPASPAPPPAQIPDVEPTIPAVPALRVAQRRPVSSSQSDPIGFVLPVVESTERAETPNKGSVQPSYTQLIVLPDDGAPPRR